jgi:hypothetical protein
MRECVHACLRACAVFWDCVVPSAGIEGWFSSGYVYACSDPPAGGCRTPWLLGCYEHLCSPPVCTAFVRWFRIFS